MGELLSLLSARADGSCVEAPPPILSLVVFSSVTVSRSVCFSSCKASTWLDKARIAWSKASCLSPESGASCFSSSTGDFSMVPSLSGSRSSGPSQCFPIAAKSCLSFCVPQPGHLFLRLDLLFEDIALKRTGTSRREQTAKRSNLTAISECTM